MRKEFLEAVLSIDPQTGGILARLAPEIHFASVISGTDGKELYGLDVKDTTWTAVGLVRLDARTGEVLARRNLSSDVRSIDLATLSSDLVQSGQLALTTNVINSR